MPTAKITITYTKSGSRYRFTCSTAESANTVSMGDFLAVVALDAFKDASSLELSVKPGVRTPQASRILLGVGEEDDVTFTSTPLASGSCAFVTDGAGVAKIAANGCGLRLRITVAKHDYDFGVGLVAKRRSDLFTPSGGLELIKLPAPSPTIGSIGSEGEITIPFPFPIPHDHRPKVIELEGELPGGGRIK